MFKNLLKLLFLVCVFGMQTIYAQITVTGTITDAQDGTTLPGVNVIVKGTTVGVSSDFDGNYSIELSDPNVVLAFSFIGYSDQEIAVNELRVINVALVQSSESLDEVVVTALGIKKETKALGYSLTELKGDEMSAIPETNAINSLQGKVAGVNITQNSTGAAGSSRVIIRGASSLTGDNQPLYVVDGIPISNENNGSAGMWGGNDGGDGISSINPQDIESVSVLKGGAASALYGSRASNGVIIITTKTGKDQEGFGVEFNSTTTMEKVDTSLWDFQTQYGQGRRGAKPISADDAFDMGLSSWGPKLDGTSVVQWDGVSRPYSYVGNNAEHFYRNGTTYTNSLAVTNSNEKINYRFSATDMDNNDIMPNAGFDRQTFSLNASSVTAEKLTSSVNAKYIIEDVYNRPRLSDAPGNANYTVANLSPNVDVRDMKPGTNEDDSERRYSSNIYSQNPYFAAENFRREDTKNRLIASASLRYDITDWLYIMGRAGIDHYTIKKTSVDPWGTAYKPLGAITETEIRYSQVDMDMMLGYDSEVTDGLNVSAFVGVNSNTVEDEILNLRGNNFIVPGLEDIGNTENQSRDRGYGKKAIGSVYGSLELAWDNWAYLTFTGRNDWFSTLSFPDKTTPNDDFYPSISGSFVLSELFDLDNFLKLRGGWSQVAGGAENPYALALTYQIFGQGHLGQSLGRINGGSVPNGNLVPYTKSEFEIGVDGRLFDNRFSFDLAYYSNETTNDIVPVGASVFSGYGSALANIGVIQNEGFEMLLSGTPIQTDNFNWKSSFNVSYNDGTVIATNEEDAEISLGAPRTRNVEIKHIVGEPYGSIVGVSYVRDDAGNIIYDIDSEGVPLAQRGPREILGEGVPPVQWGWSNTFTFRNFNLYFLIDGKSGGQIFSGTNTILTGNGLHKNTLEGREGGLTVTGIDAATGTEFSTVVAPENLSTYYGRIGSIAEEFVEDADFIKFRQLSIGYSLPYDLLKNVFLENVNISFIATNLFYLMRSVDNIDPESAYNVGNAQGLEYFGVPSTKSYGLNLKVKF
ncbi:MAG: SusC/RagA family TonB-linked outer membrane protein [Bacteroidota bacterium]